MSAAALPGPAAHGAWRLWQRAAADPRARAWMAAGGARTLRTLLLRGALVARLRALRWFR